MKRRLLKVQLGTEPGWKRTAVTWSPNGQWLVSGDLNGLVEVWEVPTGQRVASAQLHTAAVKSLTWSPNGQRVASASEDRTVRVWDPLRGEELLKLDVPKSDVTHLEWSPNGRRLAGATADGAMLIWDATAGYEFVHGEAYSFEQVHHLLNQATQLWQAGRKNEALALYEQTLEANKPRLGSFPRWVWMGITRLALTAMSTGTDPQAIALYQLVARLNKDDDSDTGLGEALLANGLLDEAVASFREAWTRPSPPIARTSGSVAIASYHEAVRLDGGFAQAHSDLGEVLLAKGQLDEAIASFREAIRLKNDFQGFRSLRRDNWTRPSPPTARPSGSTRTTPRPTITSS